MEPARLQSFERRLEGQPVVNFSTASQQLMTALHESMANFRPPSDFRASNTYRWISGRNLAYRVFEEATNIARWQNRISSEGGM